MKIIVLLASLLFVLGCSSALFSQPHSSIPQSWQGIQACMPDDTCVLVVDSWCEKTVAINEKYVAE